LRQKLGHSQKLDGPLVKVTQHLTMIEAFIPILVAAGTGFAVLINKLHNRMGSLDTRVDTIELTMATQYVPKSDINYALDKIDVRMERIEDKINDLINK